MPNFMASAAFSAVSVDAAVEAMLSDPVTDLADECRLSNRRQMSCAAAKGRTFAPQIDVQDRHPIPP